MVSAKRIDRASKQIKASMARVFAAFVDPQSVAAWLPPEGMRAEVHVYEPRPGGVFRITLTYLKPEHAMHGKSSESADVVKGTFLELLPNERMVWLVDFDSKDPAYAGTMKMSWSLKDEARGTQVSIACENVPSGIRPEDHDVGMRATLENLAAFVETEST